MRVSLLLLSLLLGGCAKASFEQCEEICARYAKLHHWERFAAASEGLAEAESRALRAVYEAQWAEIEARQEDLGRANCVTECRKSASPDEAQCMLEAADTASFDGCQP